MGVLTHAQLVSTALELAGNIGLTTPAQTWLGMILRRLHEQFGFPQQDTVKGTRTQSAGSATFTVGGTSANVFSGVAVRGIRQLFLATSAQRTDWEELTPASLHQQHSASLDAAARTGRPQFYTAEPRTDGFTVSLAPVPDRAYDIVVIIDGRSPGTQAYSAGTVNYYPDDWTVVQGIFAMALAHQQDERAAAEMMKFEAMARQDRVRYGNMNNEYSVVKLGGPHVRRNRNTNNDGWMGPV